MIPWKDSHFLVLDMWRERIGTIGNRTAPRSNTRPTAQFIVNVLKPEWMHFWNMSRKAFSFGYRGNVQIAFH